MRADKNITLEELAKLIGKSKQTVQKYESGVISNISLDVIEKLAVALDSTPGYITGWKDEKNYDKVPLYKELSKLKIGENDLTPEQISNIVDYVIFVMNKKNT